MWYRYMLPMECNTQTLRLSAREGRKKKLFSQLTQNPRLESLCIVFMHESTVLFCLGRLMYSIDEVWNNLSKNSETDDWKLKYKSKWDGTKRTHTQSFWWDCHKVAVTEIPFERTHTHTSTACVCGYDSIFVLIVLNWSFKTNFLSPSEKGIRQQSYRTRVGTEK